VAGATQAREVLRAPHFLQLYSTRLVSAAADGIFQAALASYVFFSPEKATTPTKAAATFAALLLPYSIAGPFVGVFLDRWRRQRVLVLANAVKVALVLVVAALVLTGADGPAFFVTAIAALGVNRLFLSALSAALPHLVDEPHLVTANALSTTSGSIATIGGVGVGGLIRLGVGSGPAAVASIVGLSAAVYGISAAVAATMGRELLGPDDEELAAAPSASVGHGLVVIISDLRAAIRHIARRPKAARALGAIGAHRFLFGVASLTIVLLNRNYFSTQGNVNGGLLGLGAAIGAVGAGIVVAALITPAATERFGATNWITILLLLAAAAIAVFGLPFQRGLLVAGAFVLGVSAQGVKICVDTTVQEQVDDRYRGRVFSVYDMLFNVTYVAAAAVAATVLPESGKSIAIMASVAGCYGLVAVIFAWASRRALPGPDHAQPGGTGLPERPGPSVRPRRPRRLDPASPAPPEVITTRKPSSEESLRP
jgi:MFS family permease